MSAPDVRAAASPTMAHLLARVDRLTGVGALGPRPSRQDEMPPAALFLHQGRVPPEDVGRAQHVRLDDRPPKVWVAVVHPAPGA